jgi:PD-(D/E)XK nuclease superfamily
MDIDNSRAAIFRECPWKYYEQYLRNGIGIEAVPFPGEGYSALEYGGRIHERMEEHYTGVGKYPPHLNDVLETEAEIMMQAYQARYPDEQLDIVDVERTFRVALPRFCPGCYNHILGQGEHFCPECGTESNLLPHVLVGKMDLVVRNEGKLDIIDHKSEKRGAKSNLPQKWGARDQASLYLWAAERIYKEPIGNFYVNVLTRQSEKGQIGPSFPPERQKLERNQRAIDIAIRDIVVVADEIERYKRIFKDGEWPANREMCYTWGYCPFYQVHRYGEDPSLIIEHRFQPKEEYLHLAGVPIIQ